MLPADTDTAGLAVRRPAGGGDPGQTGSGGAAGAVPPQPHWSGGAPRPGAGGAGGDPTRTSGSGMGGAWRAAAALQCANVEAIPEAPPGEPDAGWPAPQATGGRGGAQTAQRGGVGTRSVAETGTAAPLLRGDPVHAVAPEADAGGGMFSRHVATLPARGRADAAAVTPCASQGVPPLAAERTRRTVAVRRDRWAVASGSSGRAGAATVVHRGQG